MFVLLSLVNQAPAGVAGLPPSSLSYLFYTIQVNGSSSQLIHSNYSSKLYLPVVRCTLK